MRNYLSCMAAAVLLVSSLFSTVSADEVLLEHEGIKLRADLNLAADKTLADGVIMMLHGTLAHNRMEIVSTVSELLNDAGYNTLAVNLGYALDQRADGMLDCAIEHRHRHEDAVQELNAWMDWLKQEGAGKVAVWGHSRGGNQVAWFASEHDSDLISQYILVAPATHSAEAETEFYDSRYSASLSALMAKAEQMVADGKGDELMEVPGFVYCENAKATAAAFVSYGNDDGRKHTPNLLGKITKPVLLIIGSADEVVSDLPAQLKDLAQDNIQVETIEGADHFFRDLYADEMAEMIDGFLNW